MQRRWRALIVMAPLVTLLAGTHGPGAQETTTNTTRAARATPAAKVGDEVITLEDVEQAVRPQLARIEV